MSNKSKRQLLTVEELDNSLKHKRYLKREKNAADMLVRGDSKHFRIVSAPKNSKAEPKKVSAPPVKKIDEMKNIELFKLISETEDAETLKKLSVHPQKTVSEKAIARAEKLGIILEEEPKTE